MLVFGASFNPFDIQITLKFDKCDYVEQIKTSTDDLTFVQLNVHGITNKTVQITQLLENCVKGREADVVLLCETWLSPFSPSIAIPGYEFYHIDRSNKKVVVLGYWSRID